MADSVEYNGTTDVSVWTGVAGLTLSASAHSLLIVVKFLTDSGWASLIECNDGTVASLGRSPNHGNGPYYSNGGGIAGPSTPQLDTGDAWMVLGSSKTVGTTAPRFHVCTFAGSNTHVAPGTTLGNSGDPTSIRIGGAQDFANVRVVAAAMFNVELADADFEGVRNTATTQSIFDLDPIWLVDAEDEFAADYIGSNDRTSHAATTSSDKPTGWVNGLGGEPALPPRKLRTVQSSLRW